MFKKFRYIPSAITLLKITKNWYDLPFLVVGLKNQVILRNGLKFKIVDYMNLLQLVEIVENEDYKINLKNPKVIIDIGANIGDSTIYFAKKFPNSKIYAFEPVKKTFRYLQQNLKLNNIVNIVAINSGILARSGHHAIYTNALSGFAGFSRKTDNSTKETITTVNLSYFFKTKAIKSCDLIKMDCEGAEYEILLKSDEKTLKTVKNYIIEYHEINIKNNHQKLVMLFKKMGYKVIVKQHQIETDIGIIKAFKK